ncbi:MAG: UbiA prenyltransferase family protein [Candidatus Thorarchaeota archaeon]
MALKHYIKLMRPHQWYKNFLVYLAIIFANVRDPLPAILNLMNYIPLTLGFAAFCLVSSAGYIFNDVKDIEEDAAHPEKKNRPLPSGSVARSSAVLFGAALMAGGLALSFLLDGIFFILVIFYIINSQAYNYFLRNYAVVDVVTIGIGFIIRAVSGTFLVHVPFTSWLILGVFFIALILGFGKRKNELMLLGDDAGQHKKVFTQYNMTFLDQAVNMSATWLVFFYTLYVYQNFGSYFDTQPVLLTVPIVAGLTLRYVFLIYIGHAVARKPHLAIKDRGMVAGIILFGLVLAITVLRIGDQTIWTIIFNFFHVLIPDYPII